MRLPEFKFRVGKLLIHNLEQWDLDCFPLVCFHYSIENGNGSKRLYSFGKIEGHVNDKDRIFWIGVFVGVAAGVLVVAPVLNLLVKIIMQITS